MFNPESVNLSSLPSLPLSDRNHLPKIPCVYFAMSNGTIQYIGQTTNLRIRWSAHHRYSELHPDSHIVWLEISNSSLLPEVEKALIAWFQPPLNGKISRGDSIKSGILTMQVTTGEHQNVRVLVEDLEALKQLKRDDEVNIAVTFHRVIKGYKVQNNGNNNRDDES